MTNQIANDSLDNTFNNSSYLLILTAIHEEYRVVQNLLRTVQIHTDLKSHGFRSCTGFIAETSVYLAMTGMGNKAAREGLPKILQNAPPLQGALIWGYCGGLDPSLEIADAVVISQSIHGLKQKQFEFDLSLLEKISGHLSHASLPHQIASLVTVDRVIQEPKEKTELQQKTKTRAVDMEVAELVEILQSENIPVVAIKYVVDDAKTELPDFNSIYEKGQAMQDLHVAEMQKDKPDLMAILKKNMSLCNQLMTSSLPIVVQAIKK